MKKNTLLLIFLTAFSYVGYSQNILTLEEATEITLANNYGIKIAKNSILIAQNNTDKKVNGYMPSVTANAGLNGNFGGGNQTFNTGQEVSVNNALTLGANASVGANYTIFDKGRDITMTQLREAVNLRDLELQQTIEQSILQVYTAYYSLAQLTENIVVLEEALAVSQERLRRAQTLLDYGQGNGLNVLNATVDIQRDSINLINTKQQITNAQRNLNVLMGRTTDESFRAETAVDYDATLDVTRLLEEAQEKNSQLQASRQNRRVNEMELKKIDAENRPKVTAGASYDFNITDNPDASFITNSSAYGLAANVGVSVPLYDSSRKIRRQNTAINLETQKLQESQLAQQIERDLLNAWDNYQNALFVLRVEQNSVATNQENFERTEEQVRIGRLTSLEFRQAQLNLLNAQVNYNKAKYDAKLREVEVLQLAGRLL